MDVLLIFGIVAVFWAAVAALVLAATVMGGRSDERIREQQARLLRTAGLAAEEHPRQRFRAIGRR
jgi:hypothetical protein